MYASTKKNEIKYSARLISPVGKQNRLLRQRDYLEIGNTLSGKKKHNFVMGKSYIKKSS